MYPAAMRLLASSLFLSFVISFCAAASSVEAEVFPLPEIDWRVADVVPRAQGGSYVLLAEPVPALTVVGVVTNVPPGGALRWFDTSSFASRTILGPPVNEVHRVDGARREIARLQFGSAGRTHITRAITDSDGSLIVVGHTSAENFPATGQLFAIQPTATENGTGQLLGFVARTNAAGTRIERAVLIGGTVPGPQRGETVVRDVARDSFGNLYLVGNTSHTDFPVTADAAKKDAGFSNPAKFHEGFLMKLDRNLQRVLYSTFVGSDEPLPTSCEFPEVQDGTHVSMALAVRIGAQQEALVYVATNGKPIPPTQGAVNVSDPVGTPQCQWPPSNSPNYQPQRHAVSVLRLNTAGSEVVASAYLGRTSLDEIGVRGSFLLQQQADSTLLAVLPAAAKEAGTALRLMKLDASLGAVLAESELADEERPILYGVAQQPDGTVWMTGRLRDIGPYPEGGIGGLQPRLGLGQDLLVRFRALDLRPDAIWRLPDSVGSNGLRLSPLTADLLSPTGVRTRFPLVGEVSQALLGYANAAGALVKGTVSPYEFVSLYGVGLGPETGSGTSFDAQGMLPTDWQGVSVRIDGVACPLLYVSERQVNLIAPAMLADKNTGTEVLLELLRDGAVVATRSLLVAAADPHFFRHTSLQRRGESIVLNEDGTVNSNEFPARAGGAVVLFLNAAGAPPDRSAAGRRVNAARSWSQFVPSVKVWRLDNDAPETAPVAYNWPVEYFGSAPTLAAGTLQLNVRVPVEETVPWNLSTPLLRLATFSLEAEGANGEQASTGSQLLQIWVNQPEE